MPLCWISWIEGMGGCLLGVALTMLIRAWLRADVPDREPRNGPCEQEC